MQLGHQWAPCHVHNVHVHVHVQKFLTLKSVKNELNSCIMTYMYSMCMNEPVTLITILPLYICTCNNISWSDANIVIRVGRLYQSTVYGLWVHVYGAGVLDPYPPPPLTVWVWVCVGVCVCVCVVLRYYSNYYY